MTLYAWFLDPGTLLLSIAGIPWLHSSVARDLLYQTPLCTLCLEPIQSSGLDYVGVKIWSQMGCENIQIGLCTADKSNLIKTFKGVPVG